MNTMEIPEIRENLYPISPELYHQMLALDNLLEKTEWFEGIIVKKTTKSTEHNYYADFLYELLQKVKPLRSIIRKESTLFLEGSELEPDISIVEGTLKNYLKAHPKTVILVSKSLLVLWLMIDRKHLFMHILQCPNLLAFRGKQPSIRSVYRTKKWRIYTIGDICKK
jgi:hypothetical protein